MLEDPNTYRPSRDEIIPGLWVGNQAASQDCEWIQANRITLIINCTSHLPNFHHRGKCRNPMCSRRSPAYLQVPIGDPGPPETPGWNGQRDVELMYTMLPVMCLAIREELKRGGRVLVHCHAGAQRSAGLVAGYLMRYHCPKHWDCERRYHGAVRWIVKHRPAAFFGGTSVNFRGALRERPILIAVQRTHARQQKR